MTFDPARFRTSKKHFIQYWLVVPPRCIKVTLQISALGSAFLTVDAIWNKATYTAGSLLNVSSTSQMFW